MRTQNAILSAAAYCVAATTGFQTSNLIRRPEIRSRVLSSSPHNSHNANVDVDSHETGPLEVVEGGFNVLPDEKPRSLGLNRSFLGMRRESGVMRRMMSEHQQSRQRTHFGSNQAGTTSSLSNSATALMPDGGLSPCVIKVLGVGGGGSNAVCAVIVGSILTIDLLDL